MRRCGIVPRASASGNGRATTLGGEPDRLTYRRRNHGNLHVRGYKEERTITTPFDMAVLNDFDRFHLVGDAVDRLPTVGWSRSLPQAADDGSLNRASVVHPRIWRRHAVDTELAVAARFLTWRSWDVFRATTSGLDIHGYFQPFFRDTA
jgi:hypothetical protein